MVALVGCGDDAKTPDASVQDDAPEQDIDAALPDFKEYDADEGGEVRLEYMRNPLGNTAHRVTAFFYDNAGTTKFFNYINQTGCTDVTGTNKTVWPLAQNPIAERNYLDPGGIIIAGGPEPYMVPRGPAGRDPFYRDHPANEWFFKPVLPADFADPGTGTIYTSPNKLMDVVITGSAEMDAQVFDDVMYMPAHFNVVSPGAGSVDLVADTDLTVTFDVQTEPVPAGLELLSLVGFTGGNGPAVICIEPADGSVTVPAAMVNVVRAAYAGGGTMARQTLTHAVRELVTKAEGPTGKRIDFISVWCYASPFAVPPPI